MPSLVNLCKTGRLPPEPPFSDVDEIMYHAAALECGLTSQPVALQEILDYFLGGAAIPYRIDQKRITGFQAMQGFSNRPKQAVDLRLRVGVSAPRRG
jgi:hypothetical protein